MLRVEGLVSGVFREKGSEYDIRVRLSESERDLRKNFSSTFVPNVNGDMISMARISEGHEAKGFSQINRKNKARYINVSANIAKGGNLGDIINEVETLLTQDSEYKMPAGVSYGFEGQAEDMKGLFESMAQAMGLGILFIYFVLASLYESFITPFTILGSAFGHCESWPCLSVEKFDLFP